MEDQKVELISIEDLVLWTENPRDPIDENANDQDVVDRALEDRSSKWTLKKLSHEMGNYYDFSELPTVVYHRDKPVVYDGNRRMILGKIKYGFVDVPESIGMQIPDFPREVPCNVCLKEIALQNVYRKHSSSGSWQPLERDQFLYKFMNKEKSLFLMLEEATSIISVFPLLNQRFVKDEIFREDILSELGFSVENDRLLSRYNKSDSQAILLDIVEKVEKKIITTRKNRGKVIEVLEPSSQRLIDQNKDKVSHSLHLDFRKEKKESPKKKRSKRTRKKESELFGGRLYLSIGKVSDLYRDVDDLYKFYIKKKDDLSQYFPTLIRMALRLLCETAAGSSKIDKYIKDNFEEAKRILDKDIKTTLSNHNITEKSLVQLLHTGAHAYQSSSNVEQTIAMSIVIGVMLLQFNSKVPDLEPIRKIVAV